MHVPPQLELLYDESTRSFFGGAGPKAVAPRTTAAAAIAKRSMVIEAPARRVFEC